MKNKQVLNVINPSTGETLTELSVDDADSALNKLSKAQALFAEKSRQLPLHERIAILEKLVLQIANEHESFAMTIAEEGGKPLCDARIEVSRAVAGIRTTIATVSEQHGNVIPMGYQQSSSGRIAFTQVSPRGVVLAFSAFNHPLNLIIHQIIPAFASGCPCVVKPAPDTPMSCIKLIEAMYEVGVPEDYISYVITADLNIADALVRSKELAFFSFIGSAKVGWMLRSRLQPGVRCALEHGGVAPCIVSSSADMSKAIPAITKGAFYHAGQVCVSTQRVYVEESIYLQFVEQLTSAIRALKTGAATEEATDVGPLIRPQEALRVHQWVKEAEHMGAVIAVGGEPPKDNFYQPTLLLSPSLDAKASCEEIFGPVLCVYPVRDLDHALELANVAPYAFQASIFTEQLDEVYRAYAAFDASAIMVNDHTAFRDDAMPFAGLNVSGLGVGGIAYTLEEMQFEKMLVLNQH
ncbi:MAG: aldehyde dehydrogenase family protein [Gammaproteobacteria bacterium]|nr:aldehyde dehydrogenase family protein [Gammaproteobacteria bacterium]